MASVEYKSTLGTYSDDVRLDISLSVKRGVSKEDYETLRQAFNTIEDLALQYQAEATTAASTDPEPSDASQNAPEG